MRLDLPPNVRGLTCVRCGWETTDPWTWGCATCGPEARMDVRYDPAAPARMAARLEGRAFDQWRYRELLPVPLGASLPPLRVGWTPVVEAPRLARWMGVRRARVKDDGQNPSGSLKDRASAVGVALAQVAGKERIACASTGNAASATACLAASVGLEAVIFVPRRAPLPKIAQLRAFGARVLRVDADYDRTWDLCAEVAASEPTWFDRNCARNPYLVEGKKTCGLEIGEQLGPDAPDWVAVGVGDGCTVAGIGKGLREACAAGLTPSVPSVLGVQPEGAAPLVRAWRLEGPPRIDRAETVADSLCVGHPRNPDKALRAATAFVAVPDAAILEAVVALASTTGVFAEPAGAAAAAGVREAVRKGLLPPGSDVVVVATGSGLKDPAAALEAAGGPVDVAADVEAVREILGRWAPDR